MTAPCGCPCPDWLEHECQRTNTEEDTLPMFEEGAEVMGPFSGVGIVLALNEDTALVNTLDGTRTIAHADLENAR